MSRLSLTKFDGACELLSYEEIGDGRLKIIVDGDLRGRLFIDSLVFEFTQGGCDIDISSIPDGEYTPLLYVERDMIAFPRIRKAGNLIKPIVSGESEILLAAKRSREAVLKARALEKEVERLGRLIEGSRLAIGLK